MNGNIDELEDGREDIVGELVGSNGRHGEIRQRPESAVVAFGKEEFQCVQSNMTHLFIEYKVHRRSGSLAALLFS